MLNQDFTILVVKRVTYDHRSYLHTAKRHLNSICEFVKLAVAAEITQLFAVWIEVCTGDSIFMPLEVSL